MNLLYPQMYLFYKKVFLHTLLFDFEIFCGTFEYTPDLSASLVSSFQDKLPFVPHPFQCCHNRRS